MSGSYVAVTPEVLQEFDLSQSPLGQDLFTKDIGDLLNGNPFASLVVRGRTADAQISQCSQLVTVIPVAYNRLRESHPLVKQATHQTIP